MSDVIVESPDYRAFMAATKAPSFVVAELDGRWRLCEVKWPNALIEVRAATGAFTLRFDLSGYPSHPPTAQLWDQKTNARLTDPLWPRSKGGRIGTVFRTNWMSGTALYLPCDRVTINTHPAWQTQMPAQLWRPDGSIVQYLEVVYELLNSLDFLPPSAQAA
ncbi:hypothetical protein [Paraburkholderia sp. BCC1884]|uniref:DUF7665 family protein n=1 Tax=Paraburkholderia sp. BCC1884 TaxID=2562668 RepID=UPI00118242C9|nr:hypothetical protein [Paraburkholderia sp. BCC1884]